MYISLIKQLAFNHDNEGNSDGASITVRKPFGGAVILALYVGLKIVFPGEGSDLYPVFRFIRYFFVGLWVTLGAPWKLFGKINTEVSPST